jgi:hypothetical protein
MAMQEKLNNFNRNKV